MKLGIGIITYNRLNTLMKCIERVRRHTTIPYVLLVADDGSTDGTQEWCEAQGIPVVTGSNRGVAWNKNRALYSLQKLTDCNAMLLLEDDCWPADDQWAQEWYHAACRWHHINYAHEWMLQTQGSLLGGKGTVEAPYRTRLLGGVCTGISRYGLERIGYLDSRFHGYGHGHVEWFCRFLRYGFGGQDDGRQQEYFSIKGGLESHDAPTYRDSAQVRHNEAVYRALLNEGAYRLPWQNKAEEEMFQSEIASVAVRFHDALVSAQKHTGIEHIESRLRNLERMLRYQENPIQVESAWPSPDNTYKQVEALINLHSILKPNHFLPPLRGWAISPDIATFLYATVVDRAIENIIELGSGSSTLIFAYALARTGRGRIISIDHDAGYCQATQALLQRHGLEEYCEVMHAPLREYTINGRSYRFYDLDVLGEISGFQLLFIDGPPGSTNQNARFPAVPLLNDRLTDDALVILDDANRLDEINSVKLWLSTYPAMRPLRVPEAEKGVVALAKLARFVPDWPGLEGREQEPSDSTRPSHEELYRIWQASHKLRDAEQSWIAEAMAKWPSLPTYHFAIVLNDEQLPDFARTLGSLAEQFVGEGWSISIVSTAACPFDLSQLPMLHWHPVGDRKPLDVVNEVLRAADSDWVGMIEAGDQLAPHTFFKLSDAVLRHPEWQLIYSDEDSVDAEGNLSNPYFKSDFDIDLCRSAPYAIGGLMVIEQKLFTRLGGFRIEAEGIEYWDLVLRAYEILGAGKIGHVSDILYHRYIEGGHTSRPVEEVEAARKQVLVDHLQRTGQHAVIEVGLLPGTFHLFYKYDTLPLISVIIPTKDQPGMIRRCVETFIEKTTYSNYELLIVDNGTTDPEAQEFLTEIARHEKVRILSWPKAFNYSAMNNYAAEEAKGDYLLLLNNDTAILQEQWLDEMVSHAQRPDVGIVGARLLYPNGRLQHAGVILGLAGNPADHIYIDHDTAEPGYFGRAQVTQGLSAVTAACLMVRKSTFFEVGGLDDSVFQVSFNDVDLCLKVRAAGLRVVWTPFANLLHEGSVSQRSATENKAKADKLQRFRAEAQAMFDKWPRQIAFDPAYNRNLSLEDRAVQIEIAPALTWDPDWRPRPRILAHPADRMGCGEYRIVSPMRALNAAGSIQGWETGRYISVPELLRLQPDAIVVQRQVTAGQLELFERYVRNSKAFRVYEIDDLITNVPIKNPNKSQFVASKDLHKLFRKGIGMCNRLVVSTDYLAETYRGYTDEVMTVPNFLERAVWGDLQAQRRQSAKPRVGWAGSVSHHGDLHIIIDVVKATLDEVDWVFFGMCPEELKPLIAEFHPPVKLEDYPAKLASLNLDLAIAPLEDVPFNHGKSHLRLLEYGVLGYPVICTDITPYRGAYPVTRVPNKFKNWTDAIREHVSDLNELARRGDVLREHIQRQWMLEDNLDVWLKAWLPS